jgi:hypothetical protein
VTAARACAWTQPSLAGAAAIVGGSPGEPALVQPSYQWREDGSPGELIHRRRLSIEPDISRQRNVVPARHSHPGRDVVTREVNRPETEGCGQ